MKRIAIIGPAGAGKLELARRLGDILGIRVIHLDAVHWRPGWVEPPKEEWQATLTELVRGDSWIMDGNYSRTMDVRFEAADTIVFLDLPRIVYLWRVIKRSVQYRGQTRPDMAPGCPEKLDWTFLEWVWRYPHVQRPAILALLAQCADTKRVFGLRTAKEVSAFVAQVRHAQ